MFLSWIIILPGRRFSERYQISKRKFCERLGVKKLYTNAHHPQTNAHEERFNRFLCAYVVHNAYYSDKEEMHCIRQTSQNIVWASGPVSTFRLKNVINSTNQDIGLSCTCNRLSGIMFVRILLIRRREVFNVSFWKSEHCKAFFCTISWSSGGPYPQRSINSNVPDLVKSSLS